MGTDGKLVVQLSNDIKDFVAEWIMEHHQEIALVDDEHSDRAVVLGGLSMATGYLAATLARHDHMTKGQMLGIVELVKKMTESQAEASFDELVKG